MGEIKSARAIIKKIRNIFRQNVEPKGEIPTEFREAIEIQNVTYQYEEGEKRFSLEPVCEKIYPGEKILIIGASGSGKSTLLKLLYKRLTPQEGKLLLDGKNYRHISSEGIRKIFSILHQEVFLFKGSLSYIASGCIGNTLLRDGRWEQEENMARIAGVDLPNDKKIEIAH